MRIGDRPLKDLSDRELEEELQRRRRARGHAPTRDGPTPARWARPRRRRGPPGWKVRQWFRNLELEPGASQEEVELAYVRLSEKYHPDRQSDPEKKRVATQLAAGLREAYRGIQSTFEDE